MQLNQRVVYAYGFSLLWWIVVYAYRFFVAVINGCLFPVCTGAIPASLDQLSNCTALFLGGNQLSGEIPSDLLLLSYIFCHAPTLTTLTTLTTSSCTHSDSPSCLHLSLTVTEVLMVWRMSFVILVLPVLLCYPQRPHQVCSQSKQSS